MSEVIVRARVSVDATELDQFRAKTASFDAGGVAGGPTPLSATGRYLIQNASITIQNASITVQTANFAGAAPGGGGSNASAPAQPGSNTGGDPPRRDPRRDSDIPGAGFIGNAASTATGIALGGSILGFLTGSAERWQATDIALGALDRRFDALTRGAGNFAASMGVARAEAAGLLEVMGAQTDTVDLRQARTGVGFARATGTDPSAAMRFMGTATRRGGFTINGTDLTRVAGQARMLGQGQGMLPEFMDALSGIMNQQFDRTGTASLAIAQMLMNIPSIIYGNDDPRARGMDAVKTLGSMQGMLSGSTSGGMRVEMLRAMGYGREGGPDYMDAMERLDAGAMDPRNLRDMMRRFRAEGLSSREVEMLLLPEARSSGMSVRSLRTMTARLMSDEGMAALSGNMDQFRLNEVMGDSFVAGLSSKDRAAFAKSGFVGLGERGTVASQYRTRQLDDLTASTGAQMLQSVMDMTQIAMNLGGAFNDIIKAMGAKDGFLGVVNDATGALSTWTGEVRSSVDALVNTNAGTFESFQDVKRFAVEALTDESPYLRRQRAMAAAQAAAQAAGAR